MTIQEISLSDAPVTSMELDLEGNTLIIVTERAFHITNGNHLGETHLQISNWKTLKASKYVSKKPGKGEWEVLVLSESPETFNLIQEIGNEGEVLIFRGFSKESGQWLIYEISNPTIQIQTEDKEPAP